MLRHLAALAAALCLLPGLAGAAVVPASAPELTAAFKAAACGEEIQVAPGTVERWRPGAPAWDCSSNPVVITGADPANPPVFRAGVYVRASDGAKIASAGVTMDGWPGVTFRSVVCDVSEGGFGHAPCFSAAGSANVAIAFEGNLIFGRSDPTVDVNGAAELGGIGYGIAGKYAGLRIVGNTFRDLPKGIVLGDSSDVLIADNDMTGITTDNVQFGGLVRGRFARNLFLKKALPDASTAHPDCVQGLKGGRPSVDVAIVDNLCRGTAAGKASQGVFVSDEPANDNVRIERNTVLNMGYWAVSVQALTAAANDNVALSERLSDQAVISWAAGAGEASRNTANRFNNLPAGSLGNVTVARSTSAEIDAAQAAWMAKFRPGAPEAPPPPSDPRDAVIAALQAEVAALEAESAGYMTSLADVDALAASGRKARAKNEWFDRIRARVAVALAP